MKEGEGIDYHENKIDEGVELHENRPTGYYGLIILYFSKLKKLDKLVFFKIFYLILIIYFFVIYLYKK